MKISQEALTEIMYEEFGGRWVHIEEFCCHILAVYINKGKYRAIAFSPEDPPSPSKEHDTIEAALSEIREEIHTVYLAIADSVLGDPITEFRAVMVSV